ncbi:hypothetical protein ACIGC1_23365 [Peribacillus butanolivorans]|uniref:hypothetical protein n=1 Tax=Peribacillus butanolivorans TaxID=421767 RepID=UPI0037CA5D22
MRKVEDLARVDFIHIISDAIIMRSTSYSKIKMAIENLSSEGWFRELYEEAQYTKVIWHNRVLPTKRGKHTQENFGKKKAGFPYAKGVRPRYVEKWVTCWIY